MEGKPMQSPGLAVWLSVCLSVCLPACLPVWSARTGKERKKEAEMGGKGGKGGKERSGDVVRSVAFWRKREGESERRGERETSDSLQGRIGHLILWKGHWKGRFA
jgi:hypothetical protein